MNQGDFVRVTRVTDNGGDYHPDVTEETPAWGRVHWIGEVISGFHVEWAAVPAGLDTDYISLRDDTFEIIEPPDEVVAQWAARHMAGEFEL